MLSPSQTAQTCAIAVQGLEQRYGQTPVLRGIDLRLERGRTLALLGPSGCGKTTLLRLLAGLLAPSAGSIAIEGETMADAASGTFVPPERRGLGMVFQDYALWPHMSVAENVGFPLEMRGTPKAERQQRIIAALARVDLAGLADRRPADLSGGQQQRVAIARAIVAEPRIVLFDEPLSNLDRELRESLVGEIAGLVSSLGLTAVYVTHDHGEAFTLADEVAVMGKGEIVQLASPETLVDAPASPAVAEFLKLGAIAGATCRDGAWWLDNTAVRLPYPAAGSLHGAAASGKARVLLGRKAVRLGPRGGDAIEGTVTQSQFRGDSYMLAVSFGDRSQPVTVQAASDIRIHAGEKIGLTIEPGNLRWFPAE
ncbi:MAG TPA: ABC transporter ATP-binding protein [Mesorhizobium sp.]